MHNPDDRAIRDILTQTRVVAVVGWSPNVARPSHGVAHFLERIGMRVLPVNPGQAGRAYGDEVVAASLSDLAGREAVEMVDIFRRSDAVAGIVEEALRVLPNLKVIWMQLGVMDEASAALARARGILVVQDRCPKIEALRLGIAA